MLCCFAAKKNDSESILLVLLMAIINLWLAIRDDVQVRLLTRLTWDEESVAGIFQVEKLS